MLVDAINKIDVSMGPMHGVQPIAKSTPKENIPIVDVLTLLFMRIPENFISARVARAIIDLNRAPDDRRNDGVVKTHTCWMEQVYSQFPDENTINLMLHKYYFPYHEYLTQMASTNAALGIDCHTMAAEGPPVGPDSGQERPWICLSNSFGTCPQEWLESLADCLREYFNNNVLLNSPFKGGHIIRSHAEEMPWIQLEISRAPFMMNEEKKDKILMAFRKFSKALESYLD